MSDRTMSKRLAWLPLLTLLAMLGPVLAGVLGTLAPAFGYLPAVGQTDWTLDPFRKLSDWPGVFSASRLSLTTGLAATAVSLGIVVLITAGWTGTRAFARIERLLSPLLSVPHAAAAFGIAFLIAPSGWIARAFSPWFTGWDRPPDLLIVQDTWGLTLTAGLIAKEVPFLMLMTLATLGQAQNSQSRMVAQSLGYGRVSGWIKTVFPRVYAQIRLPVYVVLAYSMSVVDVAVILGPNTPPTLSVQIVRWMSDPDLMMRLQAAAAALLQLALVVAALVLWRTLEILVSGIGLFLIRRGNRGVLETILRSTGMVAALVTSLSIILGLASLLIWSFAGLWSFPDAIPDSLTMRSWMRHGDSIIGSFGQTMAIAGIATLNRVGPYYRQSRSRTSVRNIFECSLDVSALFTVDDPANRVSTRTSNPDVGCRGQGRHRTRHSCPCRIRSAICFLVAWGAIPRMGHTLCIDRWRAGFVG